MSLPEVLKGLASDGLVHDALDMIEGTQAEQEEQMKAIVEGAMVLSESIPTGMFSNIVAAGEVV
jgi:hypothetical protein